MSFRIYDSHGKRLFLPPGKKWRFVWFQYRGSRRPAYWRALGFPNLVRARARQAELRAERKRLKEQEAAAQAAGADAYLESSQEDL